jgi:hypothetical protein
MKKLLLLTLFPLAGFLYTFAGKVQEADGIFLVPITDSIIKDRIIANQGMVLKIFLNKPTMV